MCKLLGNLVWKIVAVYLDDLIIVGRSLDECSRNVDTVMERLASFRFRINFSKCVFTPSPNIDFLGCRIIGTQIFPGPKVSSMLSKIKPPHLQGTPKSQRHHLHVFLGMCAFVLQHCPGLKQVLAPLYIAVASDPFAYNNVEKAAFEKAQVILCNLQPYFLPSQDPDVIVELMTDASGGTDVISDPGSWSAVLGQRKGPLPENLSDGWELLQLDGGVFSRSQASWDILKKEAYALFQALFKFQMFIYGRRIRIIIDSKVLLHMFRSTVPMIKRWYAFIQTFDFEMVHVSSERNAFADCLSRFTTISTPAAVPNLLLFPNRHVPAPSLTQCGDVHPNPGPIDHLHDTKSSDAIIVVSSDTCPILFL
jgi:hypothetical protein